MYSLLSSVSTVEGLMSFGRSKHGNGEDPYHPVCISLSRRR